MRILIAYDGSEFADAALSDLRRAGLSAEGDALILSVADVWPHVAAMPPEGLTTQTAVWTMPAVRNAAELIDRELVQSKKLAAQAAIRLRSQLPGWRITADSMVDSPAGAIVKKSEEWQSDLVVVGSHGRSGIGRLFLGSVSQSVLTHAHCSVRIGRRNPRTDDDPVRIVLGVDGSIDSASAVSALSQRRWPAGTEVRVVTAIDSAVSTAIPVAGLASGWPPAGYENPSDWVSHSIQQVARELNQSGLSATPAVRQGDPKRVLVEEAEQWNADCIFVGARGARRLERFLFGSTSAAVAARAHCSVEVVRQGE